MTDPHAVHGRALSRRTLLRAGVVAGAAAAAVPATSAPASAANQTFQVATANINQNLTWDPYAVDLGIAAMFAHLLGLNEAWAQRSTLPIWAALQNMHLYQPDDEWAGTNALLARKEVFDLLDAGHGLATGTPGDDSPRPTYTHWARYRHLGTGVDVVHINTHLTPKIDANGHPRDYVGDGRLKGASRQLAGVAVLAEVMRRSGAEVVVTGDLNVDHRLDRRVRDRRFPTAILESGDGRPGLVSCYRATGVLKGTGTHGPAHNRRYIDYVYEGLQPEGQRRIRLTDYHLLDLRSSDHDGIVANVDITAVPGGV